MNSTYDNVNTLSVKVKDNLEVIDVGIFLMNLGCTLSVILVNLAVVGHQTNNITIIKQRHHKSSIK